MDGLVLGTLCMCRFEEGLCRFMKLNCFAVCKRCLPVILSVDAKDGYS